MGSTQLQEKQAVCPKPAPPRPKCARGACSCPGARGQSPEPAPTAGTVPSTGLQAAPHTPKNLPPEPRSGGGAGPFWGTGHSAVSSKGTGFPDFHTGSAPVCWGLLAPEGTPQHQEFAAPQRTPEAAWGRKGQRRVPRGSSCSETPAPGFPPRSPQPAGVRMETPFFSVNLLFWQTLRPTSPQQGLCCPAGPAQQKEPTCLARRARSPATPSKFNYD